MLKPVNIENLERLINGAYSGELEHSQRDYFCGTACCIAGWDVVLDIGLSAEERVRAYEEEDYPFKSPEDLAKYSDPWDYSMKKNNLTNLEADFIFSLDVTKEIHYAMLDFFKQGGRLDVFEFYYLDFEREDVHIYLTKANFKLVAESFEMLKSCLSRQGVKLTIELNQ